MAPGLLTVSPDSFSLERDFKTALRINDPKPNLIWSLPTAIDAETDEKDNPVSVAVCQSPSEVYVWDARDFIAPAFQNFTKLIGHNIKADLGWLHQWHWPVPMTNVLADTMLMSYVTNPDRESHSLKDLGRDHLGLLWPTYKDMVGRGKGKVTLDKQPIERVANYNGADAYATLALYQFFMRRMSPVHLKTFNTLEMPIMRLLFRMEQHGLLIDVPYLKELSVLFQKEMAEHEKELKSAAGGEEFNPRSPKQLLALFKRLGIGVQSTDKKALLPYAAYPVVDRLSQYRGVSKLYSTYVKRYMEDPGLPLVRPDFSQVSVDESAGEWRGIRTGRLSSSYHNIPRRSEKGSLLRKLFVAPEGQVMVCGDFSQIEYRLLAHFSKEPMLLDSFKQSVDVHAATAKLFGSGDRDLGKTLNFAAIYGAQAKKIAYTAKISEDAAQKLLGAYWKKLPRVTAWVSRTKWTAKQQGGVRTITGRFIPIPNLRSANPFERWHAERQAVNYTIQGSAADIMKMSMLACDAHGFMPILTVHDETLTYALQADAEYIKQEIKRLCETCIKLDVPLVFDVGYGKNWQEAKDSAH